MKKFVLLLILFTGICLSGCLNKKVTLEYKPTQGEPIKYNLSMENKATVEGNIPAEAKASIDMLNMALNMDINQVTTDTGKDGILNNELTVQSGKIKTAKGEQDITQKGQKVNIKLKKTGEFVDEGKQMNGISSNAIFPDHPVGAGETWKAKVKFPSAVTSETVELECTYTLEKFENINGQDCAIINLSVPETKFDEKGAVMKMSIMGNIAFAHEKGQIVNSSMNNNVTVEQGNPSAKMTLQQIISIKTI